MRKRERSLAPAAVADGQDVVAGGHDAFTQQVESFTNAGALQRVLGLVSRDTTEEVLERRRRFRVLHLDRRSAI